MKKSLVALAVLGVFSGAAAAQSSVTLYGVFNLAVQKTTGNGIKLDQFNGTNWVGVRGSEDLGEGNRAIFDIQWRFSPESGGNDGTANARPVYQGKTAAGLAGSWGQVEIGRMLSPMQRHVAYGDAFFGGGTVSLAQGTTDIMSAQYATDPLTAGSAALGSAAGDGGGLARTDMISYDSMNLSGFMVSAAYGFKNSAASGTSVNQAKAFNSIVLKYQQGPVLVAGSREQNRRGDKVMFVNAWYDFGVVKLVGGLGAIDKVTIGGKKGKRAQFGVQVPFGPFTAKLGYAQIKDEDTGGKSMNKIGIGGDYALSKRTYLYATYGSNKNKVTNATIKGADFGMRHAF